MTTVAFKGGVLAADTQITSGSEAVEGSISKLAKCENFMGGGCGNLIDMCKFLSWVEEGADPKHFPKFTDNFTGLLVGKGGKVCFVRSDGISRPVEAPFYAIGSGEEVAKGALVAGATAGEAVQAAIHIDLYSGGSVEALRFK